MPLRPPQLTDAQVVSAALDGDGDAFGAIVQRYESPLLRAAKSRLGRDEWAEDAVQDTFLSAFKSLASYDSEYSFRTWLWTIALNQCRRHYQRRMRRGELSLPHAEDHESAASLANVEDEKQASPLVQLIARERIEILHRLLARLPDAQADALRLRFFGGLKFQEIADAMECGLSTAKCRVRWGLTKLSEMMR